MSLPPYLTDEEIAALVRTATARGMMGTMNPGFPTIVAIDDVPWAEWTLLQRERERAMRAYWKALRRARILQRTPRWANKSAIRAVYERAALISMQTGIPHQVDHDVPLVCEYASGLHVEHNLQILTAADNASKSNRFIP